MGNSHSCVGSSHGAQLLQLAASGNINQAKQVLEAHPAASIFTTYVDRNTPLLVAAGSGHYHLVQAILEAAVIAHGPSKAMRCINHTNKKGHTALMLACMNGHAQCVAALIQNGASPLALDSSRHNTALHWAASCCRSECVQRLLASRTTFQMQSGETVSIAQIPCYDEDNRTLVKLVDRHNGWGLTALHLAVFKGSTSTVRALLRNGASVDVTTVPATVGCSPIRQAVGSTALHMAAAAEDLPMVRLLLDMQMTQNVSDLRLAMNCRNERPIDVARTVNNLLLLHLLDPSQPLTSVTAAPHLNVTLYSGSEPGSLRAHVISAAVSDSYALDAVMGLGGLQYRGMAGFRGSSSRRGGSSRGGDQPPHVLLKNMLIKLRLVLSLEAMAVETKLAAAAAAATAAAAPRNTNDLDVCSDQQDLAPSLDLNGRLSKKVALSKGWSPREYVSSSSSGSWQQQQQQQDGSDTDSSSAADTIPAAADVATAAGTASDTSDDSDLSEVAAAAAGIAAGGAAVQGGQFSSRQRILLHKKVLLKAAQRQLQQQQAAAEAAAMRSRLATLQALLETIQEMLLLLPQTPAGSSTASTATTNAAAEQQQQQQQQENEGIVSLVRSYHRRRRRHRTNRHERNSLSPLNSFLAGSSSSSSTAAGSSNWGLLGRFSSGTFGGLAVSNSSSFRHRQGSGLSNVTNPVQTNPSDGLDVYESDGIFTGDTAAPAPAVVPSAVAVEEVLSAFITPNTLSCLAAVTKLLVSSSALSGNQAAAAAAVAGSSSSSSSVDARWAEQEHALVLLKGILQAAHSSLKASQQAITLAANRLALRQRQQQQLAEILGNERRLMNSSRVTRRLLLGGAGDQGLVQRGQPAAAAAGSSSRERRRERRLERSAAARDRSAGRERSRNSRRNRSERLSGLQRSSSSGSSAMVAAAAVVAGSSSAWPLVDHTAMSASAAHTVRPLEAVTGASLQHPPPPAAAAAAAGSSLGMSGTGALGSSSGDHRGSSRRHCCSGPCGRHRGSSGSRTAVQSTTVDTAAAAAAVEELQQRHQQQRMQLLREALTRDPNRPHQQQQQQRPDIRGDSVTAAGCSSVGGNAQHQQGASSATAATAARPCSLVPQDGTGYFSHSTDASDVDAQQQQQQQGRQDAATVHTYGEIVAAPEDLHNPGTAGSSSPGRLSDHVQVHADSDSSRSNSCSTSQSESDSEEAGSICSSLDPSTCAICMDSKAAVSVSGCSHVLCFQCAYQLCCKAKGVPLCPFCRQPIAAFGVESAAAAADVGV